MFVRNQVKYYMIQLSLCMCVTGLARLLRAGLEPLTSCMGGVRAIKEDKSHEIRGVRFTWTVPTCWPMLHVLSSYLLLSLWVCV